MDDDIIIDENICAPLKSEIDYQARADIEALQNKVNKIEELLNELTFTIVSLESRMTELALVRAREQAPLELDERPLIDQANFPSETDERYHRPKLGYGSEYIPQAPLGIDRRRKDRKR